MDINTIDTLFPCYKKCLEISCEQNIDTEFTMPDYYPEVSKILKALIDVNILSKQVKDEGLLIGGEIVINMVYCCSENKLNSFTHVYPFSKLVNLSTDAENLSISVNSLVNHINCKAVAPRKLEVHGSITLNVSGCLIEKSRIVSEINSEEIFAKQKSVNCCLPLEILNKSLIVEDNLIIDDNKPSIDKILRSLATSKIAECKFINGKAVIKGEVYVEILYLPIEHAKPEHIIKEFPFSQIFDCDGADENSKFDAFSNVQSLETRTKTSIDGEIKTVVFEAKIGVTIHPYTYRENLFMVDAFASNYDLNLEYENITIENITDFIDENYVCKKGLDFTDGMLSEIYNLWCNSNIDYVTRENNDIVIKGTVYVNILGCDSQGEPVFIEKPIDFEYRNSLQSNSENIRCNPKVSIVAVNYSIGSDNKVDIAVELNINATLFSIEELKAINCLKAEDENKINKDEELGVVLYFSEKETVWNIAKKYCVSPSKICKINHLDDLDCVCCKMLLIPRD